MYRILSTMNQCLALVKFDKGEGDCVIEGDCIRKKKKGVDCLENHVENLFRMNREESRVNYGFFL